MWQPFNGRLHSTKQAGGQSDSGFTWLQLESLQ